MKILLTAVLLTIATISFADCTDEREYRYTSDEIVRTIDPKDDWNVYCDSDPAYWNDNCFIPWAEETDETDD